MEGGEKYLKLIEKELNSLDIKTRESIINELKDHIKERLDEEERQSLDKIIEIIGKPKEVAKGYLNICGEIYKPPDKVYIWFSIFIGTILFLFGLYYLIKISVAVSKSEVEYKPFFLIASFLFISLGFSHIYMAYKQNTEFKFIRNFKRLTFVYLVVGIILISIAFTAIAANKSPTKTISIPNAQSTKISIDKEDNTHILWIENDNFQYWSLHYTKIGRNADKLIDNVEIVKIDGELGHFGYYKSKIGSNGNIHIVLVVNEIYKEEEYLRYIKINKNGELTINRKVIDINRGNPCDFEIDSEGNIYIGIEVYDKEGNYIIYKKIDNKGKIISQKVKENSSISYLDIDIDSKNNVYIVWDEGKESWLRACLRNRIFHPF